MCMTLYALEVLLSHKICAKTCLTCFKGFNGPAFMYTSNIIRDENIHPINKRDSSNTA